MFQFANKICIFILCDIFVLRFQVTAAARPAVSDPEIDCEPDGDENGDAPSIDCESTAQLVDEFSDLDPLPAPLDDDSPDLRSLSELDSRPTRFVRHSQPPPENENESAGNNAKECVGKEADAAEVAPKGRKKKMVFDGKRFVRVAV